MAIRKAWFMLEDLDNHSSKTPVLISRRPGEEWKDWPSNLPAIGLDLTQPVLRYLNSIDRTDCAIDYFLSSHGPSVTEHSALWTLRARPKSAAELQTLLPSIDSPGCHLFIVPRLNKTTAQLLAHHLDISPRILRPMKQVLTSGSMVERFMFFGLEFMDMYAHDATPPAQSVRESQDSSISFHTKDGVNKHIWHLSRIVLTFMKTTDEARFTGLCLIDPADDAVYEGLTKLMTKAEDRAPGDEAAFVAMGEVVSEVFYILSVGWRTLLEQAADHLSFQSRKCMDPDLDVKTQLQIMTNLHDLGTKWIQMKRRIIGAQQAAQQMIVHPFFESIGARPAIESYLKKIISQLDEHLDRIGELREESNTLISLIFNVSTLHDTRATMAEAKAANRLALITQRISSVAFVYLPLGLSASIFGMNVNEINGGPPVWTFLVLTAILLLSTLLMWTVHGKLLESVHWRPWRSAKRLKELQQA